jgi:phosphatidylglycerophosphatase A
MKLWIAQGFGVGRVPVAPGTFGSVLGLGWFLALIYFQSWPVFIIGNLAGMAVSVWLCGEAERILKKTDPGSVVLDEIIAIPLCFVSWLLMAHFSQTQMPGPEYFLRHWELSIGVFALFRLFDVSKPWPVRQSQHLHGGWGVTIDDVLAAVYVNIAVVLFAWLRAKLVLTR